MERLIVLTGYSRCGKDTTAKALKNRYKKNGKKVDIFNFSRVLKEILSKILDISIDKLDKLKNNRVTIETKYFSFDIRTLLKRTADVFRGLRGDDFFARQIIDSITESEADVIIITDLRFHVEYETLKSLGKEFVTVRVIRNDPECKARKGDEEVDALAYDIRLIKEDNGKCIDKLYSQIEEKYKLMVI